MTKPKPKVIEKIDPDLIDCYTKAYSETCNTLRHYSNASLTVRILSIVQGIAILAAWSYALTQKISSLMIVFPIAGVLFTILLYRFHIGYFRATQFFYGKAARMEEKLFNTDFRHLDAYNKKHAEMYRSKWSRLVTLNAPFTLIGILFIFALAVTILSLVT